MRWLIALSLVFIFILSGCGADTTATKANDFSPLTQIIISSENSFIADKTSNQFTAEGNFSDLFTRDITTEVIWASSRPEFATINSNGMATAVASGTTQITATMNGVIDFFFLTVTGATISSIEISPVATSVPKGLTQQFEAIGTFSDASVQTMTNSVTWSSVATNIATIDQTGLASALEEGTTNITAAFGNPVVTDTTQLTVGPAELLDIEITPVTSEIPQRLDIKYTANGFFSDNTISDITTDPQITWSSSDESVATINPSGTAIGSSEGTVSITATMNSLSSVATLTITEVFLVNINISQKSTTTAPTVDVNETIELVATGSFSNNGTADITDNVTWSTTDSDIATVSNITGIEGQATGVSTGNTAVKATSGTIEGETTLTVK